MKPRRLIRGEVASNGLLISDLSQITLSMILFRPDYQVISWITIPAAHTALSGVFTINRLFVNFQCQLCLNIPRKIDET
jgi:hypothetical protein